MAEIWLTLNYFFYYYTDYPFFVLHSAGANKKCFFIISKNLCVNAEHFQIFIFLLDPASEADPGAYWKKGLETVTSNDNDFDRPDSVSSPMPATSPSMARYPLSPVNSPFSPAATTG